MWKWNTFTLQTQLSKSIADKFQQRQQLNLDSIKFTNISIFWKLKFNRDKSRLKNNLLDKHYAHDLYIYLIVIFEKVKFNTFKLIFIIL